MATLLFKNDESIYVEIDQLNLHLESGWSVTKEEKKEEPTNDDIRLLAKEAGIAKWEKSRIATLKKALLDDNQD